MPHTSVTLTNAGQHKNSATEDLPDLPSKLTDMIKRDLYELSKKARKRKDDITDKEVEQIRVAFFKFFYFLL